MECSSCWHFCHLQHLPLQINLFSTQESRWSGYTQRFCRELKPLRTTLELTLQNNQISAWRKSPPRKKRKQFEEVQTCDNDIKQGSHSVPSSCVTPWIPAGFRTNLWFMFWSRKIKKNLKIKPQFTALHRDWERTTPNPGSAWCHFGFAFFSLKFFSFSLIFFFNSVTIYLYLYGLLYQRLFFF